MLEWEMTESSSGSNNANRPAYDEKMYMRFEPGTEQNPTTYVVRFVGPPVQLFTHYNRQRKQAAVAGGKPEWPMVNFPDEAERKYPKRSRVCTDPNPKEEGRSESKCPWCRLNFQRSERYKINVIDRGGDGSVRVVELSKTVYNQIGSFWQGMQKLGLYQGVKPFDMDKAVPDWLISVKKGSGQNDTPQYSVMIVPQSDKVLTPEDIEALKAIHPGETNAEVLLRPHDLMKLTKADYMSSALQQKNFGVILEKPPWEKDDVMSGPVEKFETEVDPAPRAAPAPANAAGNAIDWDTPTTVAPAAAVPAAKADSWDDGSWGGGDEDAEVKF
jgi:hypothetical protein